MQPDAINLFEISITGTAWRRNMLFGVVWVSVAVAVARKRSAGPAAWTARKFCGIAYDTLRSPALAFLPAPLRCHWRIFIPFAQEERAKKSIIYGYKCI